MMVMYITIPQFCLIPHLERNVLTKHAQYKKCINSIWGEGGGGCPQILYSRETKNSASHMQRIMSF